jgi:surfeit locus 1 family protein
MTVLTLAAVTLFVRLGVWQWQRMQEKTALQQLFDAGGRAVAELSSGSTDALPRYTQIKVQGSYDGEHQFLLDNISYQGQPGYDVLTPLRLADGLTLMVNRGWIPLGNNRRLLPDVHLDALAAGWLAGRLDNLPVVGISLGHVPPSPVGQWPKRTSFP